jgi:uncharacterized protein (DUF2235 family)
LSRQVVVCCDGTWNEPDELRDGVAAPTNVAKLALGIAIDADRQLLFYEPGVGTSPDERVLGGAFGYGLSRNIRNCYRFLAENYQPKDRLFLFGFSRGAYTARSLAGLIRNCGILKGENIDQVDEAFAFYRDRTSHTHPSSLASQIFRRMYSHPDDDIHFIGVWDTVGALGIPSELPGWGALAKHFSGWEELWGFHDTELSSHVHFAYHALAIDEKREPFKPTLWTQSYPAAGQTVQQVWFAGVHTDTGGGSRHAALSDIALLWMVQRAQECGLMIESGRLQLGAPVGVGEAGAPAGAGDATAAAGAGQAIAPDYRGPIVDSFHGFWKEVGAYHRLEKLSVEGAPGQSIASSAARRLHDRVDGYSPPGLQHYLDALGTTPVQELAPARSG